MTYKYLTGAYPGGYIFSPGYAGLVIEASASVGGTGVSAAFDTTITNYGLVNAAKPRQGSGGGYSTGITLGDGGVLTNGSATATTASVGGYRGVGASGQAATIANFGTIQGVVWNIHNAANAPGAYGVNLGAGGTVTNGSADDMTALIYGYRGVSASGASATITNYGTIQAHNSYQLGGYGVSLDTGGTVTNGSANDTTALIQGEQVGLIVSGGPAMIANFGTIYGNTTSIGQRGAAFECCGVYLDVGTVTNGSATDDAALIRGYQGVVISAASAQVVNYGTIQGTGGLHGGYLKYGVNLYAGGSTTNGSTIDTTALIYGWSGVEVRLAPGSVANFGTIRTTGTRVNQIGGPSGIRLEDGGVVTNGSATDTAALIYGYRGVLGSSVTGAKTTVNNYGTISSQALYGAGVFLYEGGSLTTGTAADAAARVQGYSGVRLFNDTSGTVINYGTIDGTGSFAVYMQGGGTVINGSASDTSALIEATGTHHFGGAPNTIAMFGFGTATIINYGTIVGGVIFGSGSSDAQIAASGAGDVLKVEAGSTFLGNVLGGGETLDLATGVGAISKFTGGALTVSGSIKATTFQNFGTVEVGVGATFTDTGVVRIAASQVMNDAGTLTLGGSGKNSIVNAGLIETTGAAALTLAGAVKNTGTLAANGGTLTVNGAVTGNGVGAIDGGTLDLTSSFTERVRFTGTTGVLELGQSQGYTGFITGFSKTGGTSLDLADIGFASSTEATFSGTVTGGVLTVTDGVHTANIALHGNYTTAIFVASSDRNGGTIVVDHKAKAPAATLAQPAPTHHFIAAMAGLGAGAGTSVHEAMTPRLGGEWVLAVGRRTMIA